MPEPAARYFRSCLPTGETPPRIARIHQDRCGMRIPLEGDVAWHIDGARESYWRGRITSIECC